MTQLDYNSGTGEPKSVGFSFAGWLVLSFAMIPLIASVVFTFQMHDEVVRLSLPHQHIELEAVGELVPFVLAVGCLFLVLILGVVALILTSSKKDWIGIGFSIIMVVLPLMYWPIYRALQSLGFALPNI